MSQNYSIQQIIELVREMNSKTPLFYPENPEITSYFFKILLPLLPLPKMSHHLAIKKDS